MPAAKGYRSYRGRPPKGKIALAVVLVLVIVAALAVIVLQEYVVYDADGNARIDLPWRRQTEDQAEPQQEPEDVDLIIQEPETPDGARVLWLTDAPLTGASAAAGLEESGFDAVAVTMKDSSGSVYYDSETALAAAVKTAGTTGEALTALTDSGLHAIARLDCLLDSRAANADVEGKGLKNTGGYIFYDGNNLNWLDPSKEGTRNYVSQLAVECADLGFDEILLTDFTFPTEGKLDKIRYPEEGMEASLTGLLTFLRTALDQAGYQDVLLSVELPAETVRTGRDDTAGLVLEEIAPLVDRIYARTIETQVQDLADAVTAAGGALFVPELQTRPDDLTAYLVETE